MIILENLEDKIMLKDFHCLNLTIEDEQVQLVHNRNEDHVLTEGKQYL